MKGKGPKKPNVEQLVNFLRELGLDTHPFFVPAIQDAMMTGDGTYLNQLIQDQMPAIQQLITQMQLEAQKAEADPFYPRPPIEMFSGDVPIALIPDKFGEPPGGFIMTVGDFMRHMFVCGSPGTGKSRGILAMIKIIKEL